MELLSGLFLTALGVLAIPSIASLFVEGSWRHRWHLDGSRPADLVVEGQGAFRAAPVRAVVAAAERDRAPFALRAMAFSCWFLAQMVVPGFLALCLGVVAFAQVRNEPVALALMMSFAPGAFCAWLLWAAGSALVRGERARAERATRRAVSVIVGYNALAIAASVAWIVGHRHEEVLPLCLAYCAVSIVHVLAVRMVFVAHRDAYPVEHAQP